MSTKGRVANTIISFPMFHSFKTYKVEVLLNETSAKLMVSTLAGRY